MNDKDSVNTGYEAEWERAYGVDRDPIREHLIYPCLDEELRRLPATNIVDAGCGNGGLLKRFRSLSFKQAIGIDLSSEFIQAATVANDDPRVTFAVDDITKNTCVDGAWADIVFSVFVLNEIQSLDDAFAEMARIMNPSGTCLAVLTHPFQVLYQHLELNRTAKFSGNTEYFNEVELRYHFTLSEATARYFHHNFEHIVAAANRNALKVVDLKELTTNKQVFQQYMSYWRKKDVPLFLYMRFERSSTRTA
jgi:SAM-dependent methyltransferase